MIPLQLLKYSFPYFVIGRQVKQSKSTTGTLLKRLGLPKLSVMTRFRRNLHHRSHCFKACVRYFLSNFDFFTKWYSLKTEKCFLFHLKSSFHSQDIQIFVIFPLPFHTFQIQKNKWNWNNLWCHELACINLQV